MCTVMMGQPTTVPSGTRVADAVELLAQRKFSELPVVDNQYVHKGDILMVIDPTNYTIAVSQAEAAVQQAQASVQSVEALL